MKPLHRRKFDDGGFRSQSVQRPQGATARDGPTRHGRGAMRGVYLGRQVAALTSSHSVRGHPTRRKP
jgi:hypothetical protein